MKPVRPHHLVHRGVISAVAFYFPTPPLSIDVVQERILSVWVPGAIVYRVAGGLLLRLPAPRPVYCLQAPGLPLTLDGDLLLAAPLRLQEIKNLAAPPGAVVWVQNGVAVVETLTADHIDDPATWLDVSGLHTVPTESLAEAVASPQLLAEQKTFDARTRLSGIPVADPRREEIITALNSVKESKNNTRSFLQKAIGWLFSLGSTQATKATGTATSMPRKNPWEPLQRLAAQLLFWTGLSTFLQKQQAEYLRTMMRLFAQKNWSEALKYGVPLSSSLGEDSSPALSVPTPRENLKLTMQPGNVTSSAIGLSGELMTQLRTLYKRAAESLEAEGRIDEAVFVLAELLQQYSEAVALLERHKRFGVAAELAEGHALPAGLIIRLWFLAGNVERAVQIARRTGAFADAILRLERTDKERATVLRGLWAQERARAGDYATAVEIIWPIEAARTVAHEWIRRSVQGGGAVGGRMLARLLQVEENEQTRKDAIALLEETGEERTEERQAFAQMLLTMPGCASAPPLARLAVRSLWRDAQTSTDSIPAETFRELMTLTGDSGFRSDVLPLPKNARKPLQEQSGTPIKRTIAAEDRGTLPIYDAAYLPNGQCLVALGEAGVRLLSRNGQTITHFDQPVQHLVVSDLGTFAIGLIQRGSLWRLCRFDLIMRRATVWKDVPLRAFAPNYDGSLWFVAVENDFLAIDATGNGFDALWKMPNIEGEVVTIARDRDHCSLVIRNQGNTDMFGQSTDPWVRYESWHYVLLELTLRNRGQLTVVSTEKPVVAISSTGIFAECYTDITDSEAGSLVLAKTPATDFREESKVRFLLPGTKIGSCLVTERWLVSATEDNNSFFIRLFRNAKTPETPLLSITLEGSMCVTTRLTKSNLIIADDAGRLLVLSLTDGTMLRDLRLG